MICARESGETNANSETTATSCTMNVPQGREPMLYSASIHCREFAFMGALLQGTCHRSAVAKEGVKMVRAAAGDGSARNRLRAHNGLRFIVGYEPAAHSTRRV